MAFVATQPLLMVEVTPIIMGETCENGRGADGGGEGETLSFKNSSIISSPSAKLQLLNMSRQGGFSKDWLGSEQKENATYKKKYSKSNNNNNIGIDETNFSKTTDGLSSRGLWIKFDQLGPKCKFCEEGDYLDNANKIVRCGTISGDLIFQGKDEDKDMNSKLMVYKCSTSISLTKLRSDDPLDEFGVPCRLRGYIYAKKGNRCCYCQATHYQCAVTNETAVQIHHPSYVCKQVLDTESAELFETKPSNGDMFRSLLLGKGNRSQCRLSSFVVEANGADSYTTNSALMYSKLSCYNKETVKSLTMRMSTMLANTVWIGTTPSALSMRRASQEQLETMREELDTFWSTQSNHYSSFNGLVKCQTQKINTVPILLREGALLVYNAHPKSGKTTLVHTIASDILKCHAVHVVSAPALFAKYGNSADAALESLLHELALRCAVRGGAMIPMNQNIDEVHNVKGQHYSGEVARVCIILDHMETFLPLSRQASGDALNAMVAYLNRLSFYLKARNEFPYPSNNPLYNVCVSRGHSSGYSLPLGICLVGVTTCLDSNGKGSVLQSAMDAINGGRFRVPLPSAETRLTAFEHSFEAFGVKLTEDAKKVLPELASAVTWASGSAFLDVARKLSTDMKRLGLHLVSGQVLRRALMLGHAQSRETAANSSGVSSLGESSRLTKAVTFSSVGGNGEAKLALEDALALDPAKRRLLSRFGLQTPTGVLLYGPPGTGKTLLARAVAQSLYRKDEFKGRNAGGAFVALKASDVVRPEVGNSEKLIVSAFETARLNAPSLIFIDEFQALFGEREGGGFILGQLASTLLQCMDDITRWSVAGPSVDDGKTSNNIQNRRIVVLGATNTPWMIDKAFLRPGRFDRAVHVGLPSVKDSEDILRVHVSKMKLAPLADNHSPVDEICKSMAKLCLGFSGADLAAICRAAAVRCLSNGNVATGITKQNFLDAYMHDVTRSSNDTLVRKISAWQS
eukprot:CAMPEP_0183748186 /NCGR_PEP_ID=MMETSP0737-20130205/67640_1 /TAXON_ID=385413 /ORGANISM="Thalassiosira miniscula, Strain CCMP1093" /LENGTH=970 /DNA_ID=CAMNT_0025983905 /DNA_START=20 /DNA_END=2932 /DNA_ORIENTATION=-